MDRTTPYPKTSFGARIGGFVAGAALCFALGAVTKTLYSGQGFSDIERVPPQVYVF